MKRIFKHITLLSAIAAMLFLSSCSTKKNTASTRFWQAFNTRYNVYYNGASHYDEQIKLTEAYEDDYSKRLFIHPAEAHAAEKAKKPTGNYDRTITKMQKAIALHSIKKKPKRKGGRTTEKQKEWLKRDEYNPFIHNAWLMLAKAEYMNGDFLSSAATFHYISRHFTWMPQLVAEAQLWEVLSYCAMGWNTEADNILVHIHPDKLKGKKLLYLYNLAQANYLIHERKYEDALPFLEQAAQRASGPQKVRLNFLLGQLYAQAGNNAMAYKAFGKAGSSSSATYYTKFNARIKQSAVTTGQNIKGEIKSLKRMTHLSRNKEYLDQIYYAIGNLYLSQADTTQAIANYKLAAEKSTRSGIDKAISQITLGGLYFERHQYDLAQPCYSEAIPQLNDDYPNYKILKKRSDVLDELAIYAQNVTLQDSLLKLAAMTPEQQREVVKKIIEDLKRREKEEQEAAERDERLAQANSRASNLGNDASNQPTQYSMNSDNSWYFYNTATKNAGKTQFQKVWGNRKLEDDWRRRNKNVFSLETDTGSSESDQDTTGESEQDTAANAQENDSEKDPEKAQRESDPHFEEYYLKQIPSSPEEISTSHDVIQEGLYNMGVILKDKLDDTRSAVEQFATLLQRYPDNTYRLDTYYNLYLMYVRGGDTESAEKYRQLIITEFEQSSYGQALQDPNYIDNLKRMNEVQEQTYAQAYDDYINNRNSQVHEALAFMQLNYPLSKIIPKFMFIDALAYVTENDEEKFRTTLTEMLERYPDTDITPTASAMLKQLNSGRNIHSGATNTRGLLWATRLSNDTTQAASTQQLTPFSNEPNQPHIFLLAYSTDSVSANDLLYRVAYHNFTKYVVKDFDLEQMTFGALGLLAVKGFANFEELIQYRTLFEADEQLQALPKQVRIVLISQDNFNILINEGRSLEEYFLYQEQLNAQDVEAKADDTP
ncbi:MAG: tetratricopeptide repeat protein [Muribaculaceae bacterium]